MALLLYSYNMSRVVDHTACYEHYEILTHSKQIMYSLGSRFGYSDSSMVLREDVSYGNSPCTVFCSILSENLLTCQQCKPEYHGLGAEK